jgi:hypothetical protein
VKANEAEQKVVAHYQSFSRKPFSTLQSSSCTKIGGDPNILAKGKSARIMSTGVESPGKNGSRGGLRCSTVGNSLPQVGSGAKEPFEAD